MRVSVRDVATLSALKPLEMLTYLRSMGWSQAQETTGKQSVWVRKDQMGSEYEAVVPLSPTFRDFALRMGDVLRTLEVVENRSQLEILRDLFVTSADVVRVRLTDHELADGSVPIEDGAQFFQSARDLMLAAACAATGPRAYFPTKKPGQATDYLRRTRLGQTEQGSFVLTIISRVPPSLGTENGQLFEMNEPFERRVTQRLAHSLVAVRKAAEDAAATGEVKSFVDAVSKGVSANLCDAIVGMGRSTDMDRNLELDFSWSRSRPLTSDSVIPHKLLLPADSFPVIEQAAYLLKEQSPREEFEAIGPVIKLERPDGAPTGRVTIHCFIDDQPRKVTVELEDPDYKTAITAHKDEQIVQCFGVLIREGRSFRLKDPYQFKILADQ